MGHRGRFRDGGVDRLGHGGRIYFAVEQLYPSTAPVSAFPAYYLDDVFMELDNNGTGLSNAEETTTNPNAKDTDLDTMPDKWELSNGLNPNSGTDATLDPDNDGQINKVEYWANTNPQNSTSYPGITSDPLASTATKALLYYLQTRGARGNGRYLTGHQAHDIANGDYTNYVAGLNTLMTAAGFPSWVSVLGITAEGPTSAQPSPNHRQRASGAQLHGRGRSGWCCISRPATRGQTTSMATRPASISPISLRPERWPICA